ncbi:AAA family ATPase [Metabacillus schmidteae]|uniref:AAA family ATPase n=1 Tax=Metabacillus schmidteae TaxID=2730405 RepID=UPI00158AC31C|nr:AAA family ATPase [Metabacillus schmidteae]
MKTAVDFLAEWAGEESWKNHILNIVKAKGEINSSQLLVEVLQLMKVKGKADKVSDLGSEPLEKMRLIINEINTPININALSTDAQFTLGKNLNVFYGENGSGKSSYVRMFRKLADNYFTSEKDLTIIPNVYKEELTEEYVPQTVEVTYLLDDKTNKDLVDINNPHNELSKINVFDSESVLPLINSDLIFNLLPKGFEKFQLVSGLLDTLRNEVSEVIDGKKNKQEILFSDSSFDFIREELNRIMGEVKDSKDIKDFLCSNYPRSDSYEVVVKEIDLQIKELESANPKDKIIILTAQRTKLISIKQSLTKLSTMLSRDNIDKVNTLIKDYEQKVQEEREYNEDFQKNVSFLEEVNQEWFSFIKMGKKYYESINIDQVHKGESCIFCSQALDSNSVKVIESNFNHIAKSNGGVLNSIEKELLKYNIESIGVNFSDEETALFESEKFLGRVKSTIQLVNRNKELFSTLLNSRKIISDQLILDVSDVVEEINQEIKALENRIDNLKKTSTEAGDITDSRKALKETLKKNEKLHASIDSLIEWFDIQKSIKEYSKAKSKFSTNSLTQKQSEAFQKIIQGEYFEIFERFAQELKVSNVNLKLIPKKGKTLRKKFVTSEEYKVSQIMSEGEQKAVAMAEFATDLTIRKDFNTVLFDDPVTSLDYKRSEIIANLIYKLSMNRQVIVFTHNIMFYYYLYNACAKDKNKENKFFKVDEFDRWNKGIVSESFSGRLETLKEVMGKLKNQAQFINSKSCVGDALEEALKKVYSDIRTWCELIVEEGFFNSVIRRYEANIMFTKLKEIKGSFVDELETVSELFDRSCRWMAGHSQSTETQHVRANKEAFNVDMKYINLLYDHYK